MEKHFIDNVDNLLTMWAEQRLDDSQRDLYTDLEHLELKNLPAQS